MGDVQRLSVAVVVNYKTLADGKPLPLTAEQMKQIEDLTREAMGYSEKRGDTLNVVNSPFNSVEESGGELPFWQQQAFIDQLLSAGRWLLVLIVAWLLWRKGIRPQLLRRAEAEKRRANRSVPVRKWKMRLKFASAKTNRCSNAVLTSVWAPRS